MRRTFKTRVASLFASALIVSLLPLIVAPADAAPPSVSQISPTTGPTAGGFPITIVGENFAADLGEVTLGGVKTAVSVWDTSRIVCTCPEGDPGAADLVVLSSTGESSPPVSFTFDSPSISNLVPSRLPAAGGVRLTLIGQNFGTGGAARVTSVGGVVVPEVEYLGHSSIVVTSPPAPPGGTEPVCLQLPGIGNACYDIKVDPPKAQSITPNVGPISGGTVITIRGENFGVSPAYSRSVSFGGDAATDVQCPDDTRITCTLPPASLGASGPVAVIVVVEGSQDTVSTGFTYLATTGVGDAGRPAAFALRQNVPNPFTSRTAIAFDLPEPSDYSVSIFDIRGRLVRRYEGSSGSGTTILNWNGVDASGVPSPAGVFFYRVRAGGVDETRRMLLVK